MTTDDLRGFYDEAQPLLKTRGGPATSLCMTAVQLGLIIVINLAYGLTTPDSHARRADCVRRAPAPHFRSETPTGTKP